jgi:hypothetical protein
MLTLDEYLMGRDKDAPIDDEMRTDALHLLSRVSELLERFYKETGTNARKITSGYRPAAINAQVGGAKKSNHMTCKAVDIEDGDEALDKWLTDKILEEYDLYREHPHATKGWSHLQICPPKSGRRTFYP